MKLIAVFTIQLVLCAVLFFAHHHRRQPESFKSCSLAEIYHEFFEEMPTFLKPSAMLLFLLGLCGLFACLYPVAMILLLPHSAAGSPGIRPLLILAGLLCLPGAAANFLAMLLSHANFAFGGSSSTKDQTAFLFIVPIFQILCGLISIAAGCSTTIGQLATRLLSAQP